LVIIALGLACVVLALFVISGSGTFLRHAAIVPGSQYVPKTRTYYVAAENVVWDYAPAGKDPYTNEPIPAPYGGQTKYNKVRYIEYTDATFTVRKPQPIWLGILGPVLRAVEGDTINVVFYNKANKPYSMHPHGLLYSKDNEGSSMEMGVDPTTDISMPLAAGNSADGLGAKIMPGGKYTYTWYATKESAPQENEGGSKVWWYHSHVNPTQDIQDGLVGPIVITSAKHAKLDGTPDDVDKEFVTMFMIFDQSKPGMAAAQKEGSMKYSINGYIFDNLPGLVMNKGDKVRWYLLGMGGEMDIHTPHWHGEVVLDRKTNTYTDVMELLPGSMDTIDMLAYNPGTWMYHCHVADHITGGMFAMFTVNS
jgi:manganese oxidase